MTWKPLIEFVEFKPTLASRNFPFLTSLKDINEPREFETSTLLPTVSPRTLPR
jgi:hypothetical protein